MAQSPSDKAIDATEDLHSSDERARKRIKHAQDDTRAPTGSILGLTATRETSGEAGLAKAVVVSHDAKNASPAPSLPAHAQDHATPSTLKQEERHHAGAFQAAKTAEAVRGCGHEVQIEDLAHLHCGRTEGAKAKAHKSSHKRRRPKLLLPVQQLLPCTSQAPTTATASAGLLQAPIVPSQSELQFPLAAVVVSHAHREQRRRKKTERAAHLAAETEPAAVKVALTWPEDVADVADKSSNAKGKWKGKGKGKGPVTHASERQRDQSQHESQHKRNKQAAAGTSRALLPSPLSQSISNNPSLLTNPVRRSKRGKAPPRHRQTPEGPAPSCLLESRNPSYFQQPRFAQWHLPADNPQALGLLASSNPLQQQPQHQQQVYNNPDMMWIDPETAIDYTAVFARPEPLHLQRSATSALGDTDLTSVAQDNDKYIPAMDTPMTEASWFTAPAESYAMGYDLSGDEAGASSPDEDAASSLQSSPDTLAQPLDYTFAEAPALRGPGFELDTLFDWDQADASLFADTTPGEVPLSALAFERALASQFSYSHADPDVSMPASLSAASLQATAAQQQWRQRREQADGPPPPTFSPAESTLTFSREGSAELQETAVFETSATLHADGDVAHAPTSTRTTGPALAVIKSPKIKKQRSIHGSDDEPLTQCHNCGVTKTPLWRRTPCKRHSLCNACGLYLKQYNHDRPLNRASRQPPTKIEEGVAPTVCANCAGTQTSLWRKDESGAAVCNACGLYSKLHGKARPVGMRKEKVARRKRFRNLPPSPPTMSTTAMPMATAMMASMESMDFSAEQLATGAAPQAEVPVAAVAAAAATDLAGGTSESPHSAASVLSTPVAA